MDIAKQTEGVLPSFQYEWPLRVTCWRYDDARYLYFLAHLCSCNFFVLIYLFPSWFIIILVPLHNVGDWLMFPSSITGWPTFSLSSWFGIPGNFKLMRNVVGFHAAACRCFAHVVWAMVHHFFAFYLAHYVLIYLIYCFIFLACILFSQEILGLGS